MNALILCAALALPLATPFYGPSSPPKGARLQSERQIRAIPAWQSETLALPALVFLHPFSWKGFVAGFFLLGIGFSSHDFGGSWKFQEWLDGLRETFKPPNPYILVMSKEVYFAAKTTFYLPEHWEEIPYPPGMREGFGMILIDQSVRHWYEPVPSEWREELKWRMPLTDKFLTYCFNALTKDGKLVIVEKRKPVIVFEKNGD